VMGGGRDGGNAHTNTNRDPQTSHLVFGSPQGKTRTIITVRVLDLGFCIQGFKH
jgi:hypothetical protein